MEKGCPASLVTESCVGAWALEALGTAKAIPTIAVVRISFSFIGTPLGPRPWQFVVYHSDSAASRREAGEMDAPIPTSCIR
jgi:hypothetical protein